MINKKISKKLKIYYTILTIILFTGFITSLKANIIKNNNINNLENLENNNQIWLNIFFHGIISIAPILSFETMGQIRGNKIDNTVYKSYVKNARGNSFFNRDQMKQKLGLQKINPDSTNTANACSVIAKVLDKQYTWIDKNIKNHHYTFGWSGLMTDQDRYEDAKTFYHEYYKEIKKFHDKGIYPKTRLIGFSHGGNVCLSLAKVLQQEKLPRLFDVDQLILLGMPVMDDTNFLVNDPVFKKTYHFHSRSDRIQVLDFTQAGRLFSKRKFKANKDQTLTDNLFQIRIEMFKHLNLKSGWGYNKQASNNQNNKKKRLARHSSNIRKCSPGHCEWWFLKYTNKYYRDDFALSPLPMIAFIPTIIANLENTELIPNKTKTFGNQLTISLRPFECSMQIKTKKKRDTLTFLSQEKFNLLNNIVYQYSFEKTEPKDYQEQIDKELAKAKLKVVKYQKKTRISKKRKHRSWHTRKKA